MRELAEAVDRVPAALEREAPRIARELAAEREAAEAAVERHLRAVASARRAGDDARAARAMERARRADDRRATAVRFGHALSARAQWSWKLITISPPRDVRAALTPELLRRAVTDVWERVTRVWDRHLSVGGAGAMIARVECSSGGHVHAHLLALCPWIEPRSVRATAGCIVDVRRVEDFARAPGVAPTSGAMVGAITEALKYSLKSISPTRGAWIGGERWRAVHPELAASWVLGTRRTQLLRCRGILRDVRGEEEDETAARPEVLEPEAGLVVICACPSCGAALTSAHATLERTRDVARELGALWARRLVILDAPG